MKQTSRLLLVLSIVAAILAADQVTKAVARADLRRGEVYHVIGNEVILVRVENNGAFLNLGSSWSPIARRILFSVLTAAVTALLVVYLIRSRRNSLLQTIALSAVAGGGVSNIVDRVGRGGLVTDFLNVGVGSLRTGIFNVADFFILSGVILFLFSAAGRAERAAGRGPGEAEQ